MKISELSIIIPAYNEEENISDVIRKIISFLNSKVERYEILIIDDGSTDRTPEIVTSFSDLYPIRLIRHRSNQGKGAALQTGFKNATYEWILMMDADNQIPIENLLYFFPYTDEYNLIIGIRTSSSSSYLRRFASMVYRKIISLVLGIKFKDLNCPFKLFKSSLIKNMKLRSKGFLIDAEMLWKSIRAGAKIKSLEVNSFERIKGKSSVRLYHVWQTLWELFLLTFRK